MIRNWLFRLEWWLLSVGGWDCTAGLQREINRIGSRNFWNHSDWEGSA